jgi:hypothetical protein
MAKQEGSQALLVVVALVAFVLGRCTAGEGEPSAIVETDPQSLYDPPAADRVPEGFELVPDEAPVPFISHSPSRSHGGRAFANCSEARAAGAAPVYVGDAGYAPRLDRDGDGVGCE